MKEIPAQVCSHWFCSGAKCTWPERRAALIGEHLAKHARSRKEAELRRTSIGAGGA